MAQVKVVIEKHLDGYIAYPLRLKGVIVSQADTYDEVVSQVASANRCHIETFGSDAIENSGG